MPYGLSVGKTCQNRLKFLTARSPRRGDATAGHYYSQLMTTAHAGCHWPAAARFTEHGQLGIVTCYRPASSPTGHTPCSVTPCVDLRSKGRRSHGYKMHCRRGFAGQYDCLGLLVWAVTPLLVWPSPFIIIVVCRRSVCVCVRKDDNWRSVNYQNEDSVHKFEADMKQLGIEDIQQYTFGQYFLASSVPLPFRPTETSSELRWMSQG